MGRGGDLCDDGRDAVEAAVDVDEERGQHACERLERRDRERLVAQRQGTRIEQRLVRDGGGALHELLSGDEERRAQQRRHELLHLAKRLLRIKARPETRGALDMLYSKSVPLV